MKKKIFILCFAMLFGCASDNYIPAKPLIVNDLQDVEDTIDLGNQIVKNLEDYKSKHNTYPKKLNDLVPEYYNQVPKTKMKEKDYKHNIYIYRPFNYSGNKDSFGINFDLNLNEYGFNENIRGYSKYYSINHFIYHEKHKCKIKSCEDYNYIFYNGWKTKKPFWERKHRETTLEYIYRDELKRNKKYRKKVIINE